MASRFLELHRQSCAARQGGNAHPGWSNNWSKIPKKNQPLLFWSPRQQQEEEHRRLTGALCRGSLAVVPSSGKCRKSSYSEKTLREFQLRWWGIIFCGSWCLDHLKLSLHDIRDAKYAQGHEHIATVKWSSESSSIGSATCHSPSAWKNILENGRRSWPSTVYWSLPWPDFLHHGCPNKNCTKINRETNQKILDKPKMCDKNYQKHSKTHVQFKMLKQSKPSPKIPKTGRVNSSWPAMVIRTAPLPRASWKVSP